MQLETMRKQIADVYDAPKWRDRCSLMPENQVVAVWHKFSESGKFEEASRKRIRDGKQLNMFDILEKENN